MRKKPETYYVIAYVLLVCMALCWSVDASMVYMFLGAACFFIFLGFNNRPVKIRPKSNAKFSSDRPKPASTLADLLGNIFKVKTGGFTGPTPAARTPKLMRIIVVSVVSIFLFAIAANILNSDGQSYDAINYFEAAAQNYDMEEYDSAAANYRRAFRSDPEYQEAIVGYGRVLMAKNELDSAIGFFDRALAINPAYDEAAYQKAAAYFEQKKYQETINTLNALINSNPAYYDAALLMGDSYYIQRQYDNAIPWYENAYQNGGVRSRNLCHVMAYIYDTKGENDKAIKLYREALSYDSSVVEIYQRLGELIPDENGNFFRSKAARMSR